MLSLYSYKLTRGSNGESERNADRFFSFCSDGEVYCWMMVEEGVGVGGMFTEG